MEKSSTSPIMARAKFKFEATKNDELDLNKNDVVTITQQPEGGWWEGTIDGVTGWFPSAYVNIITEKDPLMRSRSVPNASAKELVAVINQPDYRAEVLVDYLKNETEYIEHLHITTNVLLPAIKESEILSPNDFKILCGNIDEIYDIQNNILSTVEDEKKLDLPKQRVGGVFLNSGANLRKSLLKYAENHPKAVEVIKEKKKELEEVLKSIEKETKDLISGLSEPLRHLDKYHIMLHELERIVPANHADKGDLQRSASFLKATKELCEIIRKQKESQMEFLYVSQIDKIVPFNERGNILYVGVASISIGNDNPIDRFLTLFTRYFMVFEITSDMMYELKQKYLLNGFKVEKKGLNELVLENSKITIKLCFPSSGGEIDRWLSAFARGENVQVSSSSLLRKPSRSTADSVVEYSLISKPPPPPNSNEISQRRKSSKNLDESMNMSGLKFDHDLEMILPEGIEMPTSSRNSNNIADERLSQFIPCFLSGNRRDSINDQNGIKLRRDAMRDEEEEFEILRIIEGYCAGDTSGSEYHNNENQVPQLIVAENEKILIEEIVGDEMVMQEKSIVDAVYSIKDQLSHLQTEYQKLAKTLEYEQKARRRLEHILPKLPGVSSPDGLGSTRLISSSNESPQPK